MAKIVKFPQQPRVARSPKPEEGQGVDVVVIDRMRAIAEQSLGLSLVADDAMVSPDGELLDHCERGLRFALQAERCMKAYHEHMEEWVRLRDQGKTREASAVRADADRLINDEYKDLGTKARSSMTWARKIPAKTGAGIYAKALLVRASRQGAEVLAKSLAEDLANLPALRPPRRFPRRRGNDRTR